MYQHPAGHCRSQGLSKLILENMVQMVKNAHGKKIQKENIVSNQDFRERQRERQRDQEKNKES